MLIDVASDDANTDSEGINDLINAIGLMIGNHFSSGDLSEARALFPASIFQTAHDDTSTQTEPVEDAQVEEVSGEVTDTQELASDNLAQSAPAEEAVKIGRAHV